MIQNLKVSNIFKRNMLCKKRIVINRGGTRSSKSYSLNVMMVIRSFMEKDKNFLITRLEMPSLRLSTMRDFKEFLNNTYVGNGLYLTDLFHEVKSSPVHFINGQTGTKIYFVPSKNSQKVHGVKWDLIFIDEAIEQPHDVFKQFILRTDAQIYLAFNPKDEFTWINQDLEIKRQGEVGDVEVIVSSYLDNPFLPKHLVDEIENLRNQDPVYWYIYGKGEYGNVPNVIYKHKKKITDSEFDKIPAYDQFFGVDWGDVHPLSMMHFKYYNERVYGRQIYYKKYKQDDLIDAVNVLKASGWKRSNSVYCDSALPSNIRFFKNHGINALKAKKDVKDGITFTQMMPISVTDSSIDYWKENGKYKWKENSSGKPSNDPIKFDDDLMDAERYAIYSHLKSSRRFIK